MNPREQSGQVVASDEEETLRNRWSPILGRGEPDEPGRGPRESESAAAQTRTARAQPRIMEHPNDWDLVRRFPTDRQAAFGELVNRHHRLIANLCFKFFLDSDLAHDATQEIFLHVYDALEKVQEREQPFVHWLCRVATNHCRNVYRKFKREERLLDERKVDVAAHGFLAPPPDWSAEQKEVSAGIHRALAKVKPEERMAVILAEMMGFDTSEIAGITGAAEHKVRRRLRRGKEKLRKMLVREKVIHHATGA